MTGAAGSVRTQSSLFLMSHLLIFLTRRDKGIRTHFLFGFLRNVSGFVNCKLNAPGFSFSKENNILLLFSLSEKHVSKEKRAV